MVRQYYSNCTIYQSGEETRELGPAFIVLGAMQQRVIGCPHLGSTDDEKELFFTQLEREYDCCPQHDVKIVIGRPDKPTIGSFSAHQLTNDIGLRLINFASSKHMSIRSTFLQHAPRFSYTWRSPLQTCSQIEHVLIDGRHFSDIIDVKPYRGANVDSDHFLVMVKLRQKLSVVNNQRSKPTPRLYLDRLRRADVSEGYAPALGEALSYDNHAMPLGDHWRMVERAISTASELKIAHLPRSQRKEWFEEECTRALCEKNAARALMLQHETRKNVENYKRLRRLQTLFFQKKKLRSEESDEKLLELISQSGDGCSFYRRFKEARCGFAPKTAMCRDADGNLLTDRADTCTVQRQEGLI
ncbi:uncharacterized protein LOC126560715 [Anopheles maculipalpis]|uniref:uncharacterized protein LOC126560715 n=1 Tax=Anopheles maculipalpis TaxID=1496333 RepID=UPI002158AE99|nr:uncharacterized protein LOC126560715 [Anopheles maculipalpis]